MTPCDCVEGCQLADRFTPATRELMVFTKSAKRYFDLDAVREPVKPHTAKYDGQRGDGVKKGSPDRNDGGLIEYPSNPAGAPPLDWWQIPSPKPQPITQYEGEPMTATFYVGDAIEVMSKLPEKSVDLVLTSPPFLALRSYLPADHPDKALEGGSQATPGLFIDWLIDVVEACDRVLAPHGSMCIELGDTYAGSGGAGGDYGANGLREGQPQFRQGQPKWSGKSDPSHARPLSQVANTGVLPVSGGTGWPLAKSLSLIPELFRFTLVYGFNPLTGRQTERWRLRNVVRWVRPNPPVGALGDKFRPATSELMVFCKSAKRYFDLDSVRTEGPEPQPSTRGATEFERDPAKARKGTIGMDRHPSGAPPLDWWNIPPGGYDGAHYAVMPAELCIKPIKAMCPEKVCRVCGEPSRRIVETERLFDGVPTDMATVPRRSGQVTHGVDNNRITMRREDQGFSDCGHGSIVCRSCKVLVPYDHAIQRSRGPTERPGDLSELPASLRGSLAGYVCSCGSTDFGYVADHWRPGLVLDPFGGSGTTALVATGHGRDCILIDIDARNVALARDRIGPLIFEEGDVGKASRSDTSLLAEGGAAK